MPADKDLIPSSNPDASSSALLQREQLRSMFHLLSGKPDSRIKVFESPIQLTPKDITELNACVVRKLRLHSIDASTTTVKVGYIGAELNEFGTWAEFEAHHWQEPARIEELVIKWDFLVNIQEYGAPQRHTLLFRVSTDMKPGKFFQLLSSGNLEEFDNIDMFTCPAFCRVDFINAQLSKELINVVDEWHKGRPSPALIPEFYYWVKKHRQVIAEIFDHWLILSWALLACSYGLYGAGKHFGGQAPVHIAATACFFGVYSLRPIGYLARHLAGRVFAALRDIEGSRIVFAFTSGDTKRISELKELNSRQGRRFLFNAIFNIVLNIIASILYTHFFTSATK